MLSYGICAFDIILRSRHYKLKFMEAQKLIITVVLVSIADLTNLGLLVSEGEVGGSDGDVHLPPLLCPPPLLPFSSGNRPEGLLKVTSWD